MVNIFNLYFYVQKINPNILIFSFNRLSNLPRDFGSFSQLEILDLTSNFLTSKSFSNNFFELSKII